MGESGLIRRFDLKEDPRSGSWDKCGANAELPLRILIAHEKRTMRAMPLSPFSRGSTEGGTRTHTLLPEPDFESGASANSATSAMSDAYLSSPRETLTRLQEPGKRLRILHFAGCLLDSSHSAPSLRLFHRPGVWLHDTLCPRRFEWQTTMRQRLQGRCPRDARVKIGNRRTANAGRRLGCGAKLECAASCAFLGPFPCHSHHRQTGFSLLIGCHGIPANRF